MSTSNKRLIVIVEILIILFLAAFTRTLESSFKLVWYLADIACALICLVIPQHAHLKPGTDKALVDGVLMVFSLVCLSAVGVSVSNLYSFNALFVVIPLWVLGIIFFGKKIVSNFRTVSAAMAASTKKKK